MHYNPQTLIIQHLHIKEEGKSIESNRMKRSYFVVVTTFVDNQELVKIGEVLQLFVKLLKNSLY